MPLIPTITPFYFPHPPQEDSAQGGFGTNIIDSANEYTAMCLRIESTGIITKIGFRNAAVTVGADIDIRIETIGTDGLPSGTLYQDSSNAIMTLRDGSGGSYFTVNLGSGTIVQQGSDLAIKIQMNATSAGNINIGAMVNEIPYGTTFPQHIQFQGGTITRAATFLQLGVEYSGGKYPFTIGLCPVASFRLTNVTTATSYDEIGVAFTVPFPASLEGFWAVLDADTDCDAVLYNSDTTTVLETIRINSASRSVLTGGLYNMKFKNTYNLVAANTYRLTFIPVPEGAGINVTELIGSSNTVMTQFQGYPWITQTRRADSGGWLTETSALPLIGFRFSAFADDSGGGSSTTTFLAGGAWGFG